MEYLLKASAVSIIFYLCYKVFLQRDTFFGHNRWFLLVGLFTSFIIPFILIPIYIEYTPINLTEYTFSDTTAIVQNIEQPFNILDYLPIVYGIGVVFFAVKFLIQLASLSLVIFKNKREKQGCYTFVKTTNKISPFSFFNWIVYNPNEFNKTELAQIITHEKVHARQYHSVDILLTQLACVVLWFNPIIWLYNKDIKQNLEFIADHEAQQKFNSKKSYQTTLLKTSMPSHQMALSNHFYNSLIKKRIVMLHKSKSKKINLLKYLLILPILGWFIMSFNTQEVYVENIKPLQDNSTLNTPSKQDETYYILDTQTGDNFEDMKKYFETKGYTFEISNLKRNKGELIIAIDINIKSKTGSASFKAASLLPIKPIKIVLNKENNTISIGKLAATDKKVVTGFSSQEKANAYKESKNLNNLISNDQVKKALFMLNGDEVKFNDIKDLNADDIDYMNVLKGKKSIDKYGVKGKNGVIEITTKDIKWITSFKVHEPFSDGKMIGNGNKDGKIPLYIVDGKEVTKEAFEKLSPDEIHSVTVLKDKAATSIYENRGENGVILITTKKEHSKNKSINNKNLSEITAIATTPTNKISLNTKDGKEPLYIVDGKETPKNEFDKISSEKVKSIDILKDEQATKKYGDKAKNGVVEITTKKENPWKTTIGSHAVTDTVHFNNNKFSKIGYSQNILTTKTGVKINPWKVSVGINKDSIPNYKQGENDPMILLNGKAVSDEEFRKVNPDSIESVEVLKDKQKIEKYGDKAKNGIVEITTKK